MIIHKGANYGWPLREGTQALMPHGGRGDSGRRVIPIRISDTVTRGTVTPNYPVLQNPHCRGSAAMPCQWVRISRQPDPGAEGQARIRRHHDRQDLVRGNLGRPHGRRWQTEHARAYPRSRFQASLTSSRPSPIAAARGDAARGQRDLWARARRPEIRGRQSWRLYVLTKPDGMIRKVVGAYANDPYAL